MDCDSAATAIRMRALRDIEASLYPIAARGVIVFEARVSFAKSALSILLLSFACSEERPGESLLEDGAIFVSVLDPSRTPLADVSVTTMPESTTQTTDALGTVLFNGMKAGFYAVTASHPTLGSARMPVRVSSGSLARLDLILGQAQPQPGAPIARIIQPQGGAMFQVFEPIEFSGVVSDEEDSAVSLQVVWESNIDGTFAQGNVQFDGSTRVSSSNLSQGMHLITLRATDSSGTSGSATITVIVGDVGNLPAPVVLDPLLGDASGVTLNWSASTEVRRFDYRVYRAEGSGDFQVINVISNGTSRTYRDTTVQLGRQYRYRIGVVAESLESFSNVESIVVGESINVGSQVETMITDPMRPYIYALDRVNNSLHFINLDTKMLEKTIFVGSSPVDMDIDQDGNELFVANFGSTEIAVVDLDTKERSRTMFVETDLGGWDGNPYRVVCTANNTLVFTSEDQWNELKLVDAMTGTNLAHGGSLYAPDLVASPDGTRVYVAESGSSGSQLYRFDVTANGLTQVDASDRANGYGSRLAIMSGDGTYVYYGGGKFLANNLSSLLGTFSETIYATNTDGTLAVGSEHIFDGTTFAVKQPLPLMTTVMALSADESTLYLYDNSSSRIFIYPIE